MRLLLVAMPESIHTARWIEQLLDQGWTIYLFPSNLYFSAHPQLRSKEDVRYAWARIFGVKLRPGKLHICGVPDFGIRSPLTGRRLGNFIAHLLDRNLPFHKLHFRWVVRRFKPDLIHSLEFQKAGHMCLDAKKALARFPRWLATNWGSDVMLFGRLAWTADVVRAILGNCDLYSCECERDVELARSLGFKGQIWPVLPNTGGFNLQETRSIRARYEGQPRRLIMIKGYSSWSGRAIFVIEALKRCHEALKGYRLMLFSWSDDARIAMELAKQDYGIDYDLVPKSSSHSEILAYYAQARLYVGCGISDGVSTSCLEALAMGAFPIQSNTACCHEWFRDGESGFVVDPMNIEALAERIQQALRDDQLCERARVINDKVIGERLDEETVRPRVIANYLGSVMK